MFELIPALHGPDARRVRTIDVTYMYLIYKLFKLIPTLHAPDTSCVRTRDATGYHDVTHLTSHTLSINSLSCSLPCMDLRPGVLGLETLITR